VTGTAAGAGTEHDSGSTAPGSLILTQGVATTSHQTASKIGDGAAAVVQPSPLSANKQ